MGETLRGLCAALGTASLEGARPATVVSKSGAFGRPTLWRELLSASGTLSRTGMISNGSRRRALPSSVVGFDGLLHRPRMAGL